MRIVRDNTINFYIYRIEVSELRTMQFLHPPNPILSFQLCVVSNFARFYFRLTKVNSKEFVLSVNQPQRINCAINTNLYVRSVFMLKEISISLLLRKEFCRRYQHRSG